MRYFVIGFFLACAVVVGVAGFRGGMSRRPPIEVFPDMDRQPKLRPQTLNQFLPEGLSSQPILEGTVSHSKPYEFAGKAIEINGKPVFAYEDVPLNTGRVTGTTNFVETNPLPITMELLNRGQERFRISCSPCHGETGKGDGITTKFGMGVIADLHDGKTRRVIQQPDGEIFNTISNGKGVMGAYGPNIAVVDRWAIVAYLRALQRSRLATVDDVPAEVRANWKK
jgi:mono/diheme cytochrome c family protein